MIGIGQGVGLVVDVLVVGDCALLAYQENAGSKGRHRLVYLPAEFTVLKLIDILPRYRHYRKDKPGHM